MEFQYRPAQPEDAPAIRLVALDSWHVTYRDIFTPDYIAQFLDRAYSVEALEHSIQRPGRIFEVATTLVGEVVGFMQYSNSGDGSELIRIYVHPNYFRCGIGGNMIRRLEDQLRIRGVTHYFCYVHKHNEIGKAFYLKHGFVHVTARDQEDQWFMEKLLGVET